MCEGMGGQECGDGVVFWSVVGVSEPEGEEGELFVEGFDREGLIAAAPSGGGGRPAPVWGGRGKSSSLVKGANTATVQVG